MKIYSNISDLSCENGSAVALGYFDGLHMGHRAVISAAATYAAANALDAALFTFTFPQGEKIKGLEILQPEEKQLRADEIGIQHYVCPDFAEMRGMTCNEFVEKFLVKGLCAKAVFCGEDYTFGINKAGNTNTLKTLCEPLGIKVTALPIVRYKGSPVSSTRIRAALADGNMDEVNEMLQKPYAVRFPVIHGQGLGHKLGVPTINQMYPDNMQMPKSGVYASRVTINGKVYPGATGLGSRPTVSGEGISCETFISDYSGNLYGKTIRVEFFKFLQNTKKFESLDALKNCILNAAKQSEEINKRL